MTDQQAGRADSATAMPASVPRQFLTFCLAGEVFGIPILSVQEIRGWEPVSRTPGSAAYVLGVMNLRGSVIPVLDLRVRLGMKPAERTSTSVVIVVRIAAGDSRTVTVGCLVDGVSDVVNLASEATTPPPAACGTMDTHFLCGVATIDKQLVLLLDAAHLVATDTEVAASRAEAPPSTSDR